MNIKDMYKLRRMGNQTQKELEKIFASEESKGILVVVRGDRRIEKIEIDGEENKDLKNVINDALKKVGKKADKQLSGQLSDLISNM